MATLHNNCDEDIDILRLQGAMDDEAVERLRDAISTLRQQGSRKILWDGQETETIACKNLEILATPVRIFRQTGGVLALAGFHEATIKRIQRTTWHRHLNIFKTYDEARHFLSPRPK